MSVQQHQSEANLEYGVLKRETSPHTQRQAKYRMKVMVLILTTSVIATACQAPVPVSQTSPTATASAPTRSTSTPASTPTSTTAANQYADQTLGIQFTYPADFVLDDRSDNPTQPETTALKTLELWQQEKFEAIVAGEYEGGTELPPSVQVMVYPNPDRLSLTDWIASQNQQLVQPRNVQSRSLAGRDALGFTSTGLYEHENIVLPSSSGNAVILISLAIVGVAAVDEPNQRAFEQVLSTFALQ